MTMESEKTPPHSEAAERAVLGTVLVAAPECLAGLADMVQDDFFFPCHREAWEAIRSLEKRGNPVNIVSVQMRLGRAELPADSRTKPDGSSRRPDRP